MTKPTLPGPPLKQQPGLLRRGFANPGPMLDQLSATYGPVFGLGAGPARMAVIGDPAALQEMFSMPLDSFRWGYKFNVLRFVVGDESMIVSDGELHARRRSSVKSAFGRRSLNGWIPNITAQTDAAIDELLSDIGDGSSTIDFYEFGRRLVLHIVVRTLFGERLANRADEIGALFQRPQDYLESPMVRQIPNPLPWSLRSQVRSDRRALDAIIDEQIAYLRENPSDDARNVLAKLVVNEDLSDSEIRDQVLTLIGAGFDTTSASLAWIIWRVSLSDGLWKRLRAEADDVFGSLGNGSAADEQSLADLKLSTATMKETMRLHPAGVIAPREAASDLDVAGHHISKGTLVLWSAYLAGRDPQAWDDPLAFSPERFLGDDGGREHLARTAWVPFGKGQRNCIGFALAQMELTLIVSRLAQRLDISPHAMELPKPVGMVVNRPDGGVEMRVTARTD